jgi:hypothetical protein
MNAWMVGTACLAVGLYGAFTARDRSLSGRRGLAFLAWIPFAIWIVSAFARAWRNP